MQASTQQLHKLRKITKDTKQHAEQIKQALRNLGVSFWGLHTYEAHYLPQVIHSNELIEAVIYGRGEGGTIMLVATDRRIISIDAQPFFKKAEDISYDVVAGVTLEWVLFSGTLVLHTRMGDFVVHTFNRKVAAHFQEFIEERCIDHELAPSADSNTSA